MYQNFWPYALFVVVALVSIHYLSCNCMTKDFGMVMTFLAYLVVAYIVATSMRHTIIYTQDDREKSVRLSFDCLVGLFLLVTAYCKYSGKLMSIPLLNVPLHLLESGAKTGIKAVKSVY